MASPYNFTTVVEHTSNATFRAWGLEFSTALSTIGLVQTADTGQINWTTVAYNSTGNTVAGFEIWRFVDSTLYIKFEYGTGSSGAGSPEIWVTVGTGSNGSGTITGSNQTSTRNRIQSPGITPASPVTAYTSYFSRTADHVAICWKQLGNGSSSELACVIIGKTVDSTGAATTTGYAVFRPIATALQSVRLIATAQVFNDSTTGFACMPGLPTTSLDDSGNFQSYMINVNVPKVLPFMWANLILPTDLPRGVTFSVAQVGSTPRTYLSIGPQTTGMGGATAANSGIGMLYE